MLFPTCDEVFELTCLFIEGLHPDTPPLLGLHDILNFVRITFDKTPRVFAPSGISIPPEILAPYGVAIFERYEFPS